MYYIGMDIGSEDENDDFYDPSDLHEKSINIDSDLFTELTENIDDVAENRQKGDNPLDNFDVDDELKAPSCGHKVYYNDDVEFPNRCDFSTPVDISQNIIYIPNDIKEDVKNSYTLITFGPHIGGNRLRVDIVDFPITFHVLVDGILTNRGPNEKYYLNDQYLEKAQQKLIEILSSIAIPKSQFEIGFTKIMENEFLDEDRLKQDIIDLCKTYKVDKQMLIDKIKAIGCRNALLITKMLNEDDLSIYLIEDDIKFDKEGDKLANCVITGEFANLSRGYEPNKVLYLKVEFMNKNAIALRKRAIKICNGEGLQTFNNDLSSFYRKASRENDISLTKPLEITNYKEIGPNHYRVSCNDVKRSTISIDKTKVLTFDIETISKFHKDGVPLGDVVDDYIFMLCMTYHDKNEKDSILKICLTTIDADPDKRWLTYVCKDQEDLLKAFARLFKALAPDIITGFNDSDYDWPFIVKKANLLGILPYMISEMNGIPTPCNNDRLAKIKKVLAANNISFDSYLNHNVPELSDEESDLLYGEYYEIRDLMGTKTEKEFDKYKKSLYYKKDLSADDLRIKKFTKFNINKMARADNLKKCFNYQQNKKIKIDADNVFTCNFLKLDGCISMDTRVCFKKLWTKEDSGNKSSLNGYLKLEKLDLKADLPISLMFKYVREHWTNPSKKTLAQNRIIANYCVHDALRCHELLLHRDVYNEYREVSDMAYTSFNDAYLIANGAKVRNMLVYYGYKDGIFINLIAKPRTEEGKYPGAFVLKPQKGRSPEPKLCLLIEEYFKSDRSDPEKFIEENYELFSQSRPVTGEDFSSLYPSIMMAYNLSPEKIILSEAELNEVISKYPNIKYNKYSFVYNEIERIAWAIFHENDPQKMGLYPRILIELFNKRAEMKKDLKLYEMSKEIIEKVLSSSFKDVKDSFEAIINDNRELVVPKGKTLEEVKQYADSLKESAKKSLKILISYENCDFHKVLTEINVKFNGVNTKQKALKVFMNTFYGEAGNGTSPLFLLEHAGGVTCLGQKSIKFVKSFVDEQKYVIKYGDTDSLYVSCPNEVFRELDIEYLNKKINMIDYWTGMVNITMRELNSLGKKINNYLKNDNGTTYLKMAYEEVLFPVVFTGKKKYYGKAHVNIVNFDIHHDEDIFVRGIDVIKRGISELSREIGYNIMKKSLGFTTQTMLEITMDEIKAALERDYDYEKFKLSMAWKPMKKNVTAQTFIKRMEARGEKIPDPGERFYYVVIKSDIDDHFKITGNKNPIKKGQVMEFFDNAKRNKLSVDKTYYFNNSVVGICARFINCEPEFYDDEDDQAQNNAKKYLEKYLKEYNVVVPKEMMIEYKRIYKAERAKMAFLSSYKKIDYTLFLEKDLYSSKIKKMVPKVSNNVILDVADSLITANEMKKFSIKMEISKLIEPMTNISVKIHEMLCYNVKNARKGIEERVPYNISDDEIGTICAFEILLT